MACIPVCGQNEAGLSIGFINSSNPDRIAEGKANSHLIVAAPDLLAAAERVLAKLDHPTLGVTIYDADALREAIAKARGEA